MHTCPQLVRASQPVLGSVRCVKIMLLQPWSCISAQITIVNRIFNMSVLSGIWWIMPGTGYLFYSMETIKSSLQTSLTVEGMHCANLVEASANYSTPCWCQMYSEGISALSLSFSHAQTLCAKAGLRVVVLSLIREDPVYSIHSLQTPNLVWLFLIWAAHELKAPHGRVRGMYQYVF